VVYDTAPDGMTHQSNSTQHVILQLLEVASAFSGVLLSDIAFEELGDGSVNSKLDES
jgi:hypothetical protein